MLVSPAQLVAVAKATITECAVTEVEQCPNSETLLIDLREPAEFQKGHIPGATLLPRGLLEFEIQKLANAERPIGLYCGNGGRSTIAAQTLESIGYENVSSMAGGIIAWATAHLPLDIPV